MSKMPLHCHYEYNGDGRFPYPRIKGWDKHYLGKWRRRQNKKLLDEEIRESEEEAESQLREYEIQHLSWWLSTMPSDHKMRDAAEGYLSQLISHN